MIKFKIIAKQVNHTNKIIYVSEFTTFEFISEGPRGKILKLVQFTLINKGHDIYNLAFGDKII